ncbi:MAG: hypothetical protein ACRD96_20175, partial [Bryobacteraceae bacterium]
MQLELPERPRRNVGVVLVDPDTGRVFSKLREDWRDLADSEDAEVLEHLPSQLQDPDFVRRLEDSASHAVQVTARARVAVDTFPRSLEKLYAEHVAAPKIIPFVTHLPVYSLR